MPSGVYTERILYSEGAGKQSTYTVPEGKRVVVRSMTARNQQANPAELWLGVHGIWALVLLIPAYGSALYPDLSLVGYERETVSIITSGTDMRCLITAYVFNDSDGTPPWAPGASAKPIEPPPARPDQLPHR